MAFESDAIDHRGVYAVGDGVTALNGAPGVELRRTELRLLVRMPANACGIKNYLRDRKSTRLNSSHTVISYAVFCLKKKKTNEKNNKHTKNKYLEMRRT